MQCYYTGIPFCSYTLKNRWIFKVINFIGDVTAIYDDSYNSSPSEYYIGIPCIWSSIVSLYENPQIQHATIHLSGYHIHTSLPEVPSLYPKPSFALLYMTPWENILYGLSASFWNVTTISSPTCARMIGPRIPRCSSSLPLDLRMVKVASVYSA